jgi:hypothetical protein
MLAVEIRTCNYICSIRTAKADVPDFEGVPHPRIAGVVSLHILACHSVHAVVVAGVSAIAGVHAVVDDSNVSSAISVARSSVAGVSANAGVNDVVGSPNVSSDLSIAGVPAAVRVSRVEPVAVDAYTLHLSAHRTK